MKRANLISIYFLHTFTYATTKLVSQQTSSVRSHISFKFEIRDRGARGGGLGGLHPPIILGKKIKNIVLTAHIDENLCQRVLSCGGWLINCHLGYTLWRMGAFRIWSWQHAVCRSAQRHVLAIYIKNPKRDLKQIRTMTCSYSNHAGTYNPVL